MDIQEYIESGVLRMYVLGYVSDSEKTEIDELISIYPELKVEVEKCENELLTYTNSIKLDPHPTVGPLVNATFDFIKRLESGEEIGEVPILNENSIPSDFNQWITREDFVVNQEVENLHVKLICSNPEVTCAMVWIKTMAPEEIHSNEYERFLILEGTCTIRVGNEYNKLGPGDYFQIPLHIDHEVIVTSKELCKVILQRVAA